MYEFLTLLNLLLKTHSDLLIHIILIALVTRLYFRIARLERTNILKDALKTLKMRERNKTKGKKK